MLDGWRAGRTGQQASRPDRPAGRTGQQAGQAGQAGRPDRPAGRTGRQAGQAGQTFIHVKYGLSGSLAAWQPGSLAARVYVHYLPFLTPVNVGARAALRGARALYLYIQ